LNGFVFVLGSVGVVVFAAVVFRVVVRSAYHRRGRLGPVETALEFCAFVLWGLFVWADMPGGSVPLFSQSVVRSIGWIAVALGLASWFAVFFILGVRRSFGLDVDALLQTGPYGLSRNPQIVVVGVAVAGYWLVWPTWHTLSWLALYAGVSHLMVLTEEEHLRTAFGESYARYALRVPRYFGVVQQQKTTAA
jgi:protein-S-isoprenylcysteine O-methyltransferase Ste14